MAPGLEGLSCADKCSPRPRPAARATAAIIGANQGTVAPLGDLVNGYGPRGKGYYSYN